ADIHIDFSFLTSSSVLFDAVYIPGGDKSVQALQQEADAIEFVKEAYKHCKTIAATGAGERFLRAACLERDYMGESPHEGDQKTEDGGLIIGEESDSRGVASKFINAMAHHRHWERELKAQPA
ncbi:MAG: DJ-1/PfpI family protein, partial [Nitrospiraceae bacterium]